MKISRIVNLHADAGWRVFSFLKTETDAGLYRLVRVQRELRFQRPDCRYHEACRGVDWPGPSPCRNSSPRTSMRARVRRRAA